MTKPHQTPEITTLAAGRATAEIAPAAGARLMRWNIGGRPVLHWPAAADWAEAARIRGGNPVLFPFIARTFLDGRIGHWRGPDGKERPAPMHGLVRAAAFDTEQPDPSRLVMKIVSDEAMAEAFPFPFVFGVEYVLTEDSLSAVFTVENAGKEPMPFSVGNHFYFEVPAAGREDWLLECPCRRWVRQEKDGTIVAAAPPPQDCPLADPSLVDLMHVGPPREGVVLRHRGDGRRVMFDFPPDAAGSNPWFCVTTWTETPQSDFYCVEPWTALPDAVHNKQGLRWLKPRGRETLRLRMTTAGW